MIPVNRNSVVLPDVITKRLKEGTEEVKNFFRSKETSQERFIFDAGLWKQTKPFLQKLFHDKCAFCESALSAVGAADVEFFRPKSIYWWLAYEWENMYYICRICNVSKANLFPIAGTSAEKYTKGAELEKEKPLLLDPCLDDPALHLRFYEDGTVRSISLNDSKTSSKYKGFDRGKVTIDTFRLNRPELCELRRHIIQSLEVFLEASESSSLAEAFSRQLVERITNYCNPINAYSEASRQIIARKLNKNKRFYELLKKNSPDFIKQIQPQIEREKSLSKFDSPTKKSRKLQKKVFVRSREIAYENAYITNIEIHNFKAIGELNISVNTFPEIDASSELRSIGITENVEFRDEPLPEEKKVGWKMLLGENGAGKSSVLKALSIALMGKDHYEAHKVQYRLEEKHIFNNKTSQKSGYIKVQLSKGEPIEIHFTKQKLDFISGETGGAQFFFRGYGAARFFSRQAVNETIEKKDVIKEVTNLFSPDKMLADPNGWLMKLSKEEFDNTAKTFRDLLNIGDEVKKPLVKKRGEVHLDSGSGPRALAQLSDGYNSVLALITDMMAGLPQGDKRTASGIVLLDEIDAHLHPTWKMRIVGSLRRCFPRIQFIATTHEPLCLKGLGEREITILKREDDGKISVRDDIQSPEGLRVDQLLTSELFGLESTIDPEVDEKFQEYYQLLAQDNLNKDQKARVNALKSELQKYNTLGFTRRDRMVYDIIDKYIARKDSLPPKKQTKLRKKTRDRVLELWNLTKLQENL